MKGYAPFEYALRQTVVISYRQFDLNQQIHLLVYFCLNLAVHRSNHFLGDRQAEAIALPFFLLQRRRSGKMV